MKVKHKSNFGCTLTGFCDRFFHQVLLDDDGKAISGFIKSRHTLLSDDVKSAVIKTINSQANERIEADKIIARLSEEDIRLIKNGPGNINEARRLKALSPAFEKLVAIHSKLEAETVKFHGELKSVQENIEHQLAAYILAAFSRKKKVDVEFNSNVNYKECDCYKEYITTFAKTDKTISEVIEHIKSSSESLGTTKKEADAA